MNKRIAWPGRFGEGKWNKVRSTCCPYYGLLGLGMNRLEVAEEIAQKLREEPYHLFRNDCFLKSIRFCKGCQKRGITSKLVWCLLGLAKTTFPAVGKVAIPIFTHFWGEVEEERLETARPLGDKGFLGVVGSEIIPLLTIKFTFRGHKPEKTTLPYITDP
jgi:hypothetical protein